MALGGGMSCVKYLLFAFNLLFAVSLYFFPHLVGTRSNKKGVIYATKLAIPTAVWHRNY